MEDPARRARAILEYWFATLDDGTVLDQQQEPFRTCYQRWYGKQREVDDEIRARFEPDLRSVVERGRDLDATVAGWGQARHGLVALTILLDQLPRNMYRDTPAMYTHDALALVAATAGVREYDHQRAPPPPLIYWMFLLMPMMHVENLTLQDWMVVRFEQLEAQARTRSPENVPFFAFASDYARRHRDIIKTFGRFPHRNALLGRTSTVEEETFLQGPDSGF